MTECTALALYTGPGSRRWRIDERKRRDAIRTIVVEMEFASWMANVLDAMRLHREAP